MKVTAVKVTCSLKLKSNAEWNRIFFCEYTFSLVGSARLFVDTTKCKHW